MILVKAIVLNDCWCDLTLCASWGTTTVVTWHGISIYKRNIIFRFHSHVIFVRLLCGNFICWSLKLVRSCLIAYVFSNVISTMVSWVDVTQHACWYLLISPATVGHTNTCLQNKTAIAIDDFVRHVVFHLCWCMCVFYVYGQTDYKTTWRWYALTSKFWLTGCCKPMRHGGPGVWWPKKK